MSPPVDTPYEFDVNHSLQHNLKDRPIPSSAWNSNPSSRASSRASMYGRLPSVNAHSFPSEDLEEDDDLEFHDISESNSCDRATFFIESPVPNHDNTFGRPPVTMPSRSNNTMSPKIRTVKRASSLKRKNGVVHIPPSGDLTVKTDLPISSLLSELLRVAQSMNMKVAEPTSTTKLHCNHKSVEMNITLRKKSITSCCLHFEWLSGGSYKLFSEVCQELMEKVHV